MGVFADPTAHSSFLGTYLVRVLAYTAVMVVVLYIAAGLVKAKGGSKLPINATLKSPSSHSAFWKTVWQRFVVPTPSTSSSPVQTNPETASTSTPILTAKQTLPLDDSHTAHVLDSPDGRWLLVTGPTGTQLHALQGANYLDQGNRYSPLDHSKTPKRPLEKGAFGPPDGWGPVSLVTNS
jgi:hypothetical protein